MYAQDLQNSWNYKITILEIPYLQELIYKKNFLFGFILN